eukprot:6490265-Amphidinium_carterae.1
MLAGSSDPRPELAAAGQTDTFSRFPGSVEVVATVMSMPRKTERGCVPLTPALPDLPDHPVGPKGSGVTVVSHRALEMLTTWAGSDVTVMSRGAPEVLQTGAGSGVTVMSHRAPEVLQKTMTN